MTYRPAPGTPTTIIEWLSQLSTFDVEEFHGFLRISPLLPQSEKAAAWHARAGEHLEESDELIREAAAYLGERNPEMARALMDGVQIRLAASQQCIRMGHFQAAMHARYSE